MHESDNYFNPRPPWGGRLALLTGTISEKAFQSTPSVGRATLSECTECEVTEISIHALRGEGD